MTEAAGKESDESKTGSEVAYWFAQLEAAETAGKDHEEQTSEAWDEFLCGSGAKSSTGKDTNSDGSSYRAYWSSVCTIQPALYSRTPVVVAKKNHDDLNDDLARLGSLCLRRLGKCLVEQSPFDRVQYYTRDNLIHAAKTTNRVLFDAPVEEKPFRVDVTPFATGAVDEAGSPITGYQRADGVEVPDDAEIAEGDGGGFYYEEMREEVAYYKCDLIPVHYKDIRHNPDARHHDEIRWIAFRSEMLRREVRDRFGKEIADALTFVTGKREGDETSKSKENPTPHAVIWEIWDKEKKRVLWLAEGHKTGFLDQKKDPYELVGFFPCPPFMLKNCGPDNLYPRPDYVYLKPLIKQLHALAIRLKDLIWASRIRGAFDKQYADLAALTSNASNLTFIGVDNLKSLVGDDGSLDKIIKFFPTDEIVNAVNQLVQIIELYEQKFYELYGIPDVLRGVSDPTETAAAQQLKGRFLSLRFSALQREFQRLVRDDIELLCDLALRKYPDDKLARCMGYEFMSPEDQALFPQVLMLLKDDEARKIRIDIETDSTITMNEAAEIEQRNYLAKVLFEGLNALQQFADRPDVLPLILDTFMYVGRSLRGFEEIESTAEQMKQAIIAPQQPQEPPPDPAMMKAQADIQVQQAKAQSEMQIAQVKAQVEIQLMQMKVQAEIYREERKAASQERLETLDAQNQQMLKAAEARLKELDAALTFRLEQQKVDNEKELRALETFSQFVKESPRQEGDLNVNVGLN